MFYCPNILLLQPKLFAIYANCNVVIIVKNVVIKLIRLTNSQDNFRC